MDMRLLPFDGSRELYAISARHHDVGKEEVKLLPPRRRQRLSRTFSTRYSVSIILED